MTIATQPQVQITITTPTQTNTNTNHTITVMKSMKLLTQHTPKITLAEPKNDTQHYDSDSSNSILDSSLDSE